MASLTVRDISEEVMQKLREAAAEERRSVNGQVIHWLEEAARRRMSLEERERLFSDIRTLREETLRRHGMGSDSAKVIRRMRDERAAHWLRLLKGKRGKTRP